MWTREDYQRLYDRMAAAYNLFAPLWWRHTARGLSWLPAGGDVLEIGHGPGLLLTAVANHCRAYGVDLSWRMIEQCRRRLAKAGVTAWLAQADALSLPFQSEAFDGVVLTFTFSAIPDGTRAMAEIARVLRPGGVAVLVDAGVPDDGNWPARMLARTWELFGDQMRDERRLMREAGLDVIHREEFGPWRCMRVVVGKKGRADR
ncbi:MAG: class I SAM-dependent methyltransferase [Anaerolineae bacterium]